MHTPHHGKRILKVLPLGWAESVPPSWRALLRVRGDAGGGGAGLPWALSTRAGCTAVLSISSLQQHRAGGWPEPRGRMERGGQTPLSLPRCEVNSACFFVFLWKMKWHNVYVVCLVLCLAHEYLLLVLLWKRDDSTGKHVCACTRV